MKEYVMFKRICLNDFPLNASEMEQIDSEVNN